MNRHIEKSIEKWYNISAFQYIDERVARTVPQITLNNEKPNITKMFGFFCI